MQNFRERGWIAARLEFVAAAFVSLQIIVHIGHSEMRNELDGIGVFLLVVFLLDGPFRLASEPKLMLCYILNGQVKILIDTGSTIDLSLAAFDILVSQQKECWFLALGITKGGLTFWLELEECLRLEGRRVVIIHDLLGVIPFHGGIGQPKSLVVKAVQTERQLFARRVLARHGQTKPKQIMKRTVLDLGAMFGRTKSIRIFRFHQIQ